VASVAILGATGAVGAIIRDVLIERRFPVERLVLLASERSAGRRIRVGSDEVEVAAVSEAAFRGVDIALFSAGAERSRAWAPVAVSAGAVVIDNSSAFRMEPSVPLVVADVNPAAVNDHHGIIANPNCSTMQLVSVLKPILDAVGLERVTVATYQAVSGTGQGAIDALRSETSWALAGGAPAASVYPHPIAFNAVPQAGSFVGEDGYTDEELKIVNESRKILDQPQLLLSATCVRVPVVTSHSEAVWVRTRDRLEPQELRELLAARRDVTVIDDPALERYPTALAAAGRDGVFVGRIRRDLADPHGLVMWIVSDNLRKGAATNAVEIAELVAAA
jgi:aspartate-semialdehyde dehydrogenase